MSDRIFASYEKNFGRPIQLETRFLSVSHGRRRKLFRSRMVTALFPVIKGFLSDPEVLSMLNITRRVDDGFIRTLARDIARSIEVEVREEQVSLFSESAPPRYSNEEFIEQLVKALETVN